MILIGLMLEEHLKPDKTNTPSKAGLWYFSISRLSLVLQHTHALVKPGLQLMRTAVSLPFLNGIDVLEEDEKLPGSFILSVWEQKVVAGNAQGSSERWMEGSSQGNIFNISGLDVLRQLHFTTTATTIWYFSRWV